MLVTSTWEQAMTHQIIQEGLTLVIGGTVKTGRRVAERLQAIHGPAVEIRFPLCLARQKPLFGCTTGFVTNTGLQRRFILQHHLFFGNFA